MEDPSKRGKEEIEAYLARIRKTIADSESLVSKAELRIAETDRMLERQGLTREQVLSMRFTDSQIEDVNAELARRGMEPLGSDGWSAAEEASVASAVAPQSADAGEDLERRRQKFGMMMKPFQI